MKLLVAALAACASMLCHPVMAQEPATPEAGRFFTIAGGDIGGNYFAIARAICREINRGPSNGMRCSPEATPGSVYNLSGLRSGELDLAIVQSDWLQSAREGTGRFEGEGNFEGLRGVAELYREAITIVVARDAAIARPGDLVGKRVDIGQPASGRRATVDRIFRALEFDVSRLALMSELSSIAAFDELCAGRLDAVFLVVGHPDANVALALSECGARIIALLGTPQGDAIAGLGDYLPGTIAAGTYPELTSPVGTLWVTATLVARSDVPDDVVAEVLDVLGNRQDALRRAAPVLLRRAPGTVWSGIGNLPPHAAVP